MNNVIPEKSGQEDNLLTAWADRIAKGGWPASGLLFLVIFAFYLVTAAGNISETDDVYAFAYRAENFPVDYLSDPRLMLYHVAMRLLFVGADSIGWDVSALTLMRLVSALCAAGSLILMLRILHLELRLSAVSAVLATLLLALSYGFWRYAAEAEVYIPAIFLILLALCGLLSALRKAGPRGPNLLALLAWGAFSGLTVLVYQPSAIPLFLAFPLLLLERRRLLHLACYLAAGGSVIVAGYIIGFLVHWPEPLGPEAFSRFLAQRASEFMVPPLSLRTVIVSMIRAAFALSHDLLSANWIFAFDPIAQLIQRAFSNNVITEEIFLAKRAGALAYIPIVTLLATAAIALRILVIVWRPSFAFLYDRAFQVVLIWALINGAVIGRLNPAGVEAWIMVFPPLVILFAALAIEPCAKLGRSAWAGAFVLAVFLHNAVGGMGLVQNPANEYDKAKGAWVIAEAKPQDLVIVVHNAGLGETLRYLSPAKVALIGPYQPAGVAASLVDNDLIGLFTQTRGRDFDGKFLRDLIGETRRSGGRVIVFDSFFQVPENPRVASNPTFAPVVALKNRATKVYEAADVGATYVLTAPAE